MSQNVTAGGGIPQALVAELERVMRDLPDENIWTAKEVGVELTKAVKLIGKIGGRVHPKGASAGWPQVLHDWSDLLAQAEDGKEFVDQEPARIQPTMKAVSRMERAIVWQARYLNRPEHYALRRALALWLKCKARRGGNFDEALKRAGIARPTAYRARDRALLIIAIGLMRDRVLR